MVGWPLGSGRRRRRRRRMNEDIYSISTSIYLYGLCGTAGNEQRAASCASKGQVGEASKQVDISKKKKNNTSTSPTSTTTITFQGGAYLKLFFILRG